MTPERDMVDDFLSRMVGQALRDALRDALVKDVETGELDLTRLGAVAVRATVAAGVELRMCQTSAPDGLFILRFLSPVADMRLAEDFSTWMQLRYPGQPFLILGPEVSFESMEVVRSKDGARCFYIPGMEKGHG